MTFKVGDIIEIFPPTVNHKKYEICLGENEFAITICVFLNSENKYEGGLAFDCARFPMLPKSKTGQTVVSLSNLERYTAHRLAIFRAALLGELSKDVAAEIVAAVKMARTLNRQEKLFIEQRLTAYISE